MVSFRTKNAVGKVPAQSLKPVHGPALVIGFPVITQVFDDPDLGFPAGLGHGLFIAEPPGLGVQRLHGKGFLLGQMDDMPMPKVQEMAGRVVAHFEVVIFDPIRGQSGKMPVDHDDDEALFDQADKFGPAGITAHSAQDEDMRIDGRQLGQDRRFLLGIIIGIGNDDLVAVLAGAVLAPVDHGPVETVADIRRDKGDPPLGLGLAFRVDEKDAFRPAALQDALLDQFIDRLPHRAPG